MKKTQFWYLFILLAWGCTRHIERLGDNKQEGFINKRIKFVDYSKKSTSYQPLSGILLKVDSLSFFRDTTTIEFENIKTTWSVYLASVGLKLGEWKGLKMESLKYLKVEQVKFRISVTTDSNKSIHQQLFNEAWMNADSVENGSVYPDTRIGIQRKNQVFLIYKLNELKDGNELIISTMGKVLKIKALSTNDEDLDWSINYVMYELLEGVAFKMDETSIFIPSFALDLSSEEILNLKE
ncbi:MAG: hypothetical protein SFV55_29710 [Haliscomenobacter sp.]|uniref:hypothetical protein n=1 Tax=Haliscomenobacter sp. TaxID=2717303 RepID=UPI0029B0A4BC|nr:hypothetical protein [Haliscomenobacter sp.]MDX2072649.1 hypothetical protein [Haliscomenobacter sp.]